MRLFVPFLILSGDLTWSRKIKKGSRWKRKIERIELMKQRDALMNRLTLGGEKDFVENSGASKFQPGLFGEDRGESFGRRTEVVLTASNEHLLSLKKEWTPCIGNVISNQERKGRKIDYFNQCLINKGYSIEARKCINWTRFGAIDLAITEDAQICRPICKDLLNSLDSVADDMEFCSNKPEDDSVERGGKGKKRKKKNKKGQESVETFETDGFMMFDDEVVEEELQEERLEDQVLLFDDDFDSNPSRGPAGLGNTGTDLSNDRFDATSRLEMVPSSAPAETGNPKKGKRKARKENRKNRKQRTG